MSAYETFRPADVPWINMIPTHWETKRLKELLAERKESNNPVKTTDILSLTNTRGVIPYAQKGNIGNKSKENLENYKLAYPNDLVLNSMNVIIGSVGLSQYFGAVSPVYYMLYPRKNDNIRYFEYIFKLKTIQEYLKGLGNGILAIRMRIPMIKLNNVLLPVPPREEQDQIVRYLDWQVSKTNKLISALKKQIALLKELKQAVINKAVTKGGEGWQRKPLKYWVKSNVSSLSSNTSPCFEIDYLDISSVGHGYIKKEPIHLHFKDAPSRARRIVQYGDTIISTVRTYLRSVCFIDHNYENCIVSTGFSVLSPNKSDVLPELLSFVLSSDNFIDNVIRNSVGVSYPAISDSKLLALKVVLPVDLNEQQNLYQIIKQSLRVFDSLMARINSEIALLVEYRTRLISDVVTGQVDVRDIKVPEFEYIADEADDASEDENKDAEETLEEGE